MKVLVVAEKPSVARSLASALGPHAPGIVVASASGHLFELDLPRGYRAWRGTEPGRILGVKSFDHVPTDSRVLRNLSGLMREAQQLVVATDNDPEGEMIGYELIMLYRSIRGDRAAYRRMRFNTTSRDELRASWARLEDDLRWSWVEKALFRHSFDLLTGAAFTRLLTLEARKDGYRGLISWGSCQTPCLNFIVEREKEILNFRPATYWYFQARLEDAAGNIFTASTPHLQDSGVVKSLQSRLHGASEAAVGNYAEEGWAARRPLPARTDDALRELARITRLSAARLLSIMEDLYSRGYISYPRTETNRYPRGFGFYPPLRAVLSAGIGEEARLKGRPPEPRMGRLDDGAHPPIYPVSPYRGRGAHREVWEYIARRFYANAFAEDSKGITQEALIIINDVEFKARGRYLDKPGFYEVFHYFRPRDERIPRLMRGERLRLLELRLIKEETKPPRRLTESELLKKMEESHIGTDATRASFPELVVRRGYAERKNGAFSPTRLGAALIDLLSTIDRRLVTPETRSLVEAFMERIERGEITREEALGQSISIYAELFDKCRQRIKEVSSRLAGSLREEQVDGSRKDDRRAGRRRGY